MDVSVIFVNYKAKELTINAINSVIEKTEGLEYEIIVVDNNSGDGSIEAIEQKFPNINIIRNPENSGFGSGNNFGIRQAKGKYILCLNTDTLLNNNAIKIMFDFMEREENSNVGACGGYLTDKDNCPSICGGNFPSVSEILGRYTTKYIFNLFYNESLNLIINSDKVLPEKGLQYIVGADLFLRRSVLDKVGLFDENIFMYYEETDLCKRIKNAGYSIKFVKDAKIQHLEGKTRNNVLRVKSWSKKSELYYFKKHHPNKVWQVKIIYIIIYSIGWFLLKRDDSKELLKITLED